MNILNLNLKEQTQAQVQVQNEPEQVQDEPEQVQMNFETFVCDQCTENCKNEESSGKMEKCKHEYCKTCLKNWCMKEINENKQRPKCYKCHTINPYEDNCFINDNIVSNNVDIQTQIRYQTIKIGLSIIDDKNDTTNNTMINNDHNQQIYTKNDEDTKAELEQKQEQEQEQKHEPEQEQKNEHEPELEQKQDQVITEVINNNNNVDMALKYEIIKEETNIVIGEQYYNKIIL